MNPFDEIAVEEVSLREKLSLRQDNFEGEFIMSTDVRPARLLRAFSKVSKRMSVEQLLSNENEAKQGFEKFYRFLSTVIFFVEGLEIHKLYKFKAEK